MSRPKTDINPLRAERVKTMISREGISQSDFAARVPLTQQAISRIVNLKTALTEETAAAIIRAYPRYRIEWLLGYDGVMTHEDEWDNYYELKNHAADGMWAIIETSLKRQGKSLKFVHRQGQHVDATHRAKADCYYSIVDSSGSEIKRLTAADMMDFEDLIQDYCDFMVDRRLLS